MSGFSGVIGPAKAQRLLGEMLGKLNDPKITKVVTSRLHNFKRGCTAILKTDDKKIAKTLLALWKKDALEKMKSRQDIPQEMMSFWNNCLIIEYRHALRDVERKNESCL